MAQQNPARQLYDILVTKNFDPEMLDVNGRPASDPSEADIFSFDYTAESGNDYGTVVVMLADDNDLQVYFGDNLGKGMEQEDKTEWFEFLHQIKNFATKNLLSFSLKNLNRLKYSMQGQAAVTESIFESWTGTKNTSWNGRPTEARLMIRHNRTLGETDARFRYVESLFIETAEGERFKLPFTKLSGGRAMVEHVRQGGKVYDVRGQHISEMVNELNVISRFRRANHGKVFEGDTAQLVERTNTYYENLQRNLKHIASGRGYKNYFESWNPAEVIEQEMVIEGLKHLFVTQSIDTRIESALPLLAKIQQQGTAMKEANIFEAWIENLAEGTWALPDSKEKQAKLIELMSKPLIVGPDATNATEQLYDLLGDDELFDQLEALAEKDANADGRQVVYDRMQMLSDHPSISEVINSVQIDPEAEMNPAEPTDAGMSANPEDAQVPELQEGHMKDLMWAAAEKMSKEDFIGEFGNEQWVADFWDNVNGVDEAVKNPATQTEDPAGTKQPSYPEYQDDLAGILKAAGVNDTVVAAPDYEEEVEEGVVGAVLGGAAGALVGGPAGAVRGAMAGNAIGNAMDSDEETNECDSTPLQGQYGHSGKMKPVDKDTSFLDRLKELSGMIRN